MPTKALSPLRKRSGRWWVRRILLGLGLLVVAVAGFVFIAGAQAKATLKARYPPPGQLVAVDGYALHLNCQGQGTPTVVLEAGHGDFSLTWALIQPQVAAFTQVCTYDRAGLGWSDPSPRPQTAAAPVQALQILLTRAGVPGPYVLVGHSLGGLYVRLYTQTYPQEVAGLVLVDASHEEQAVRFPAAYRQASEQAAADLKRQLQVARVLAAVGVMAADPARVPVHPKLPPAAADQYQAVLAMDASFFATMLADMAAAEERFAEVGAALSPTLGDMPLVVLSHGQPEAVPGLSAAVLQAAEQAWQAMQREQAALSAQGQLIVAEQSGHYIQLDQPDLVIEAIREVWTAAST